MKYIFNPFLKYSEKQLFTVGIVGMIVTVVVSYLTKMQTDSIFHFSGNQNLTVVSSLLYCAVGYAAAMVFLFTLGKIFNKKTRLIDIVNTVLISQIFNSVILFASSFIAKDDLNPNDIQPAQLIKILINVLCTLPFMIYSFILYYNGFKTATNIKKWQQITIFAVASFIFIVVFQILTQQIQF